MATDKMTSRKKVAAVMIALGTDNASRVYKYLHEDEVEMITLDIATLKNFGPEEMEEVLDEFYNLCIAQKYITEGGIEYAREILNKAFGTQNANTMIEKITKSLQRQAFDFLKKVDPKYLLTFIQNEHPQTIALILSYLRPEQAAAVLNGLPQDVQIEVTECIATMDRTSPDVVREVENALEKKLSSVVTTGLTEIGGVKHMAEILNEADRGTEEYIMKELGKKKPTLAEDIRKRMFVFEDIATLDSFAIQRFLREVDTKDLLIALKGSSTDISRVFYENMSSRMSDMMKEEAQYLHGVRLTDVQEAQQKLMNVLRKLEDAGEIVIARGKKDEVIV